MMDEVNGLDMYFYKMVITMDVASNNSVAKSPSEGFWLKGITLKMILVAKG